MHLKSVAPPPPATPVGLRTETLCAISKPDHGTFNRFCDPLGLSEPNRQVKAATRRRHLQAIAKQCHRPRMYQFARHVGSRLSRVESRPKRILHPRRMCGDLGRFAPASSTRLGGFAFRCREKQSCARMPFLPPRECPGFSIPRPEVIPVENRPCPRLRDQFRNGSRNSTHVVSCEGESVLGGIVQSNE